MSFFLYGRVDAINDDEIAFLKYFCDCLWQNEAFGKLSLTLWGQKPIISEVPSDVTNM